ncbi:MAG TPA: hypothetical protein VFI02_02175 [Armatimonadota bacterium]|nr:hypothetical protein [Armatimonadota bacterium]
MDIIRTKEDRWNELFTLNVFGLRIGDVNRNPKSLEDPVITFLRNVVSSLPCAAHMSLDPCCDDQYKTFSAYYPDNRFVLTHVGVYSHLTVWAEYDAPHGVYFPRFTAKDLMVHDKDGQLLIEDLLIVDQPMLYLGVDNKSEARLRDLFLHPPADFGKYGYKWFQTAADIVPVVLAGGHDESYYHAFARSSECFDLLREPLKRTETTIRDSEWFRANETSLQWSDKTWEWCLVLPGNEQKEHLLPGTEVSAPDASTQPGDQGFESPTGHQAQAEDS